MEAVFLRILSLSLTCSAVILPLLLLGKALRSRYAPRTLYVLWLLLAVRLLIPVRMELPRPPVSVSIPAYTVEVPAYRSEQAAVEPSAAQTPPNRTVSLIAVGAALWAVGAAAVLVWQCGSYLLVRRSLLRGAEVVGLTLPPHVRAVRSLAAETPMMLGAVRPVLVLPAARLDDATLDVVLRHELCHLRRRDVAYKGLMILVSALYWFNPLMWLMAREAGRNVELCCDDEVLKNADRAERRRYGEILLAACADGRTPAFATRFGSPKSRMKERLGNLFARKRTGVALVCVLLISTLAVGSFLVLRPEVKDDTLYRNERLGFTLQLPESWRGKYAASENSAVIQENETGREAARRDYVVFQQNQAGEGSPGVFAVNIDDADGTLFQKITGTVVLGEGGGKIFSLFFYGGSDKNNEEYFALRRDALALTEMNFDYKGPITPEETFEPEEAWQWPLNGEYRVVADFGPRIHPITGKKSTHDGVDIAASEGTDVRAARSGVVSVVARDETLGNYVELEHKDVGVTTVYGQLSAVAVQEGDRVEGGQIIGSVGSTGSSTGAHLHLELRSDGEQVDPLSLYPGVFQLAGDILGSIEDESGILMEE